ncbi:putative cytochrome P450 [Lasiosphaeria ovina]|uniref:Cytochrome P450 n=1 Tax=Lasiosphaeria ovina TaxID=92902 RepID=A0AAE0N7M7_9PEZI|nr:putative cytochrome P450 [Lasiosphaeria ovina]
MAGSLISSLTVLGPAALLVAYLVYRLSGVEKKAPLPDLPILGARKGEWFPKFRAGWRNALHFKQALVEADQEYRDQAAILPMAGAPDIVLLPRSEIQFVTDQPDTVLNMHVKAMETLQIDYTCPEPSLAHNPIHHKLIVTTLTNQTGNLVPDVADETERAFARHWGTDTAAFRELCVYDTMRHIIGNVTNRVFVGAPLCRDAELVNESMAFTQALALSSHLLRFVWEPLRPLAALVLTLPNRIHARRHGRILLPEIRRRLAEDDARQRDPEAAKLGESAIPAETNDFLQWSLRQGKATGDPFMWKPTTLALRVLLLSFASLHTTSFAITNVLLDLVSSKPEYIAELRAEVERVLAEHGGRWDKRALAKMEKLDSVLRESARVNSAVTIGLSRRVVAAGGLTTPSGVHLPRGAEVCVPSYAVLQDDAVYADAGSFQPFRFAEQRADESVAYLKRAAKAFATTGTDYLAFGHGRNACPGRFFAASELKIMLAHVLLNYDLEMQPARPHNRWVGIACLPPMEATIRVKRRA